MDSQTCTPKKLPFEHCIGVWFGFVLVLSVFWGYAFVVGQKERSSVDDVYRELQELRLANVQLEEHNQQLQQACPTPTVSVEASVDEPAASLDGKHVQQRSFSYTVQKGDTIWDIAAKYQIHVNDFMRWNNLTPRSRIFPGDQLTIILEE